MIKQKIREFLYRRYNISFSKSGEDMQLKKLINKSVSGVFVDIGCWHPIKASNTYYFSLRGWKGICIDPNPELRELYQKFRPNDIFINCAIGEEGLSYYMLEESSMNTLDYRFIQKRNLDNKIKKIVNVPSRYLKDILDEHIKINECIDFFDVDVEGFDLEVLKTNNWKKYRPKIIMVETDISLKDDLKSEMNNYLESVEYRLIGKSIIRNNLGNLFFIDNLQCG